MKLGECIMYKTKSEALCTILTGFLLGHGSTGCGGLACGVEPLLPLARR